MPGSDDLPWGEIIVELADFAKKFAKGKPWFRGPKTETFFQGRSMSDYASDTILKYLEEPDKYDPSKGSLINYLCLSLLRNEINADVNSKENQTTRDLYLKVLQHDADDHSTAYFDRLLPFTEALFDDDIDYGTIMADIDKAVAIDPVCSDIYTGQCMGMKRGEIMTEFGLSSQEYVNGYRRLKTILNNVASKYGIEKPNT